MTYTLILSNDTHKHIIKTMRTMKLVNNHFKKNNYLTDKEYVKILIKMKWNKE